jgi:hypothetical protein
VSDAKNNLRDLVARASRDPAYMANAVHAFALHESHDVDRVLSDLGVTESTKDLFMLSLRPEGDRFVEMLRAVVHRFVLDETALLVLLRQVETLAAFTSHSPAPAREKGTLMAARTRLDASGEATTPAKDQRAPRRKRSPHRDVRGSDPVADDGSD